MTDDQFLLASAYADDAATADERALAEADPEVMAEVARIRALQAELAAVPPAPEAARTAMIAAAMAQFGTEPATMPAREPASPRPDARRPQVRRPSPFPRVLGMAAAVVAVLAVGGVLLNNLDNSGDDDSADTPAATAFDDTADADAPELRTVEATEAPAATVLEGADAGASDQVVTAAGPEPAAEAASSEPFDSSVPPQAMSVEASIIRSADELRDVGIAFSEIGDSANGTATPEATAAPAGTVAASSPCSFDIALTNGVADAEIAAKIEAARATSSAPVVVLGAADYRTPEGDVPVLIAVDLDTSQAYAIDAQTCMLLAVGTPP